MKILMLTPYLPYPDSSGGQIRTQNLLKHLRKEHDITLFSLIKYSKEEQYVPILEKEFCKKVKAFYRPQKPWMLSNILRTGFSLYPFLVIRNYSDQLRKAIKKELELGDYDLIHAETFYAMPHIPKTNLPVVLVDQTIEYKVYDHYAKHTANPLLRPLLAIDVAKMKFWETHFWRAASQVIAVSEDDKKQMEVIAPGLDVKVVPNGVNLDLFTKGESWIKKQPVILISNNFAWLQNLEAAQILIKEVFPIVRKTIPNAKLLIAGQHIPDHIKNINDKNIEVRDLQEEDRKGLTRAYKDATVFAAPIKGPGGTRLKILAAMASQLPVVTTTVGMTGLKATPGKHVLIGDTPTDFADKIIQLVKDKELAKKLGVNARLHVEKNFGYQLIAKDLSRIYQSLAKK